jgi:uncharacterized HAD superfamily protein
MSRYAVDLDAVVFDSNMAMLEAVNRQFGTSYTRTDLRAWGWNIGFDEEHARFAFDAFGGLVEAGLTLLPGAEDGLCRLAAAGGVSILTHRTPDLTALTHRALHGFPCHSIHLVDRVIDKAVVALELGCQVALEDSPAQALAYAEAGLDVYLFSYPYNAHLQHARIVPVETWAEVLAHEGLD